MVKQVKFNREDRDYAWYIDGELMGFCSTYQLAQQAADDYVYASLTRSNTSAADLTTEEAAAVAAVVEPAAVNVANISRQTVAAVLVEARRKVADNRRWATALAKASTELEASAWYLTTSGALVINSRSTAGKRYRVTAQGCECPAAQKGNPCCWHKAARKLLINAAAVAAQAAA
jgi:hypothetical protein